MLEKKPNSTSLTNLPGVGPVTVVVRTTDNNLEPEKTIDLSFRDLWITLVKHRKMIIGCTLGLGTLALVACMVVTPKYESTATIEVTAQNTDLLSPNETSSADASDYTVAIETEASALSSDSLALQVARELDLEHRAPFNQPGLLPSFSLLRKKDEAPVDWKVPIEDSPERRSDFLELFQKYMKVKPVSGTRMIEVSFFNPDPDLAAQVVNKLVDDHIEREFKQRFVANQKASVWLSKELSDLKKRVEESQEKVVAYQRRNGILGTDEAHNIITTKLADLNTQLTSVEANRIVKEAYYRMSLDAQPGSVDALNGAVTASSLDSEKTHTSVLQTMRIQEGELKSQLAQLSAKYGPTYPKVVQSKRELEQVENNIAGEEGKVKASIKAEYEAASKSETMLRDSFERQKREANALNDRAVQYTILKHEADSTRELYDELDKKLNEVGLLSGIRSSNVVIVDPAYPDSDPSRPRVPLYTGLGLALGLFGGVTLAFLLDTMDETVRTPRQLETEIDLPALGIVPECAVLSLEGSRFRLPFRKRPALTTRWTEATGESAEAYRALRTSLLLSHPERLPKIVAVTSPGAGEGKTTTALNLAATMARQGRRVLLVEADMRCPQLQRRLHLNGHKGLSSVLSGASTFSEVITSVNTCPGLHVVAAGSRPQYPAELLGAESFKEMVANMSADFDHVIIDTPPVLAFTDAAVVSRAVDAVVLVARFGQTTKTALRRAREILRGVNAPVIGAVVNRTDLDSADYQYYTGSKYLRDYYKRYEKSAS